MLYTIKDSYLDLKLHSCRHLNLRKIPLPIQLRDTLYHSRCTLEYPSPHGQARHTTGSFGFPIQQDRHRFLMNLDLLVKLQYTETMHSPTIILRNYRLFYYSNCRDIGRNPDSRLQALFELEQDRFSSGNPILF